MSNNRKYYDILGVTPEASPEQIKSAYRKRALELHPDKCLNDLEKAAEFQDLQEAYKALSHDMVDELVLETPDETASTATADTDSISEKSNSLVAINSFSLNSTMRDAGIEIKDLYFQACNNIGIARLYIQDIRVYELFKYNVILFHEELALEVVKKNELELPFNIKYDLALKFASVCLVLLDRSDFFDKLNLFECHNLYKKHQHIKLCEKNNEYESELAKILQEDSEANRKSVEKWLNDTKVSPGDLSSLAKQHLVVAHVTFNNSSLFSQLDCFSVCEIALRHESIALQMLQNKQHHKLLTMIIKSETDYACANSFLTILKGKHEEFKDSENYLSIAYLLAKKFAVFHQTLINSEIFNQLPVSEQVELLKNAGLEHNSQLQNRVCAYQTLTQDLSELGDDEIVKLIKEAELTRIELLNLAKINLNIARAVTNNDGMLIFLDWAIHYYVAKHEDIAIRFVTEDGLKKYLYFIYQICAWKKAFFIVLKDKNLREMLSSEDLFKLENMHGKEASQLICEAGLQEKVLAFGMIEKATSEKAGTKVSTKRIKRSEMRDEGGELLRQRGLEALDKLTKRHYSADESLKLKQLAYFYLLRAARKNNLKAMEFLVKETENNSSFEFVLKVIDILIITGNSDQAIKIMKNLYESSSEEKLFELLEVVQQRMLAPENKEELVNIGNFYFSVIDAISQMERIANTEVLYFIYRCLADMFKENNNHGFALEYISRIPAKARKPEDWLNMGEWTNVEAFNKHRAELSDVPEEEVNSLLNTPQKKLERYSAQLPYYLCAKDSLRVSNCVTGIKALKMSGEDKSKALFAIGLQVASLSKLFMPQAAIAWEESKKLGNVFARYAIENFDTLLTDVFLFQQLKRFSENDMQEMLSVLNDIRKLPRDFVVNDAPVRRKIESPAYKQTLEDLERRTNSLLVNEKNIFVRERNLALMKKMKEAFEARINQLELEARYNRKNGDYSAATNCHIRVGILTGLFKKLLTQANYHNPESNAPVNKDQLRQKLADTINKELTIINVDLKEHAEWYVKVAYGLVKALHTIFSFSETVTGWMNNFDNRFKVLPDEQRDELSSAIVQKPNPAQ